MNYQRVIINILERYNITYWTEGKNVSRDSVNIQCPFHDCDDHSNHMGIFIDTMVFNCWKCNRKGHFSFLLKLLTRMSESECEAEIQDEKISLGLENAPEEKKEEKISTSPLPEYFEPVEEYIKFPLLFKYLKRRKIDLATILDKKCGICRVGRYMNRLIIPVFYEGKQVSFVAADLTGTAKQRYEFPDTSINHYLYGYDDLKNSWAIITEGVLDAWRVQEDVSAIFGSYLTIHQKSLLLKKNLDYLIFCLDGDAYWHARNVVSPFFEPYVEHVEVIRMDFEEDPDSLGTEKIWELIDQCLPI